MSEKPVLKVCFSLINHRYIYKLSQNLLLRVGGPSQLSDPPAPFRDKASVGKGAGTPDLRASKPAGSSVAVHELGLKHNSYVEIYMASSSCSDLVRHLQCLFHYCNSTWQIDQLFVFHQNPSHNTQIR